MVVLSLLDLQVEDDFGGGVRHVTPRALEIVRFQESHDNLGDNASCDVTESKSPGDGGDDKEEGDDDKRVKETIN